MPEKYAELIAAWKGAAARAESAQKDLNAAYARFFNGSGPEPTLEERDRLRNLTLEEQQCLERAATYLRTGKRL
ncbi:hypothetical protein [Ramlibacter tataouinensis]|uniref:Uncharacterized protein n=1 Tax=Ramlibacter tataouinensis (strain ATCC BAA-407 / DSM 14655 / LMG 21543 / TTB310) TaxID=365046 RepID=F5Y689_RAMTT|nr:hypothetical protein [Ramlibacter tataouinensis]AEG92775.1 hypothetical protein Rta_16830 [Ramlibacter tataouinensis TTB310]